MKKQLFTILKEYIFNNIHSKGDVRQAAIKASKEVIERTLPKTRDLTPVKPAARKRWSSVLDFLRFSETSHSIAKRKKPNVNTIVLPAIAKYGLYGLYEGHTQNRHTLWQ